MVSLRLSTGEQGSPAMVSVPPEDGELTAATLAGRGETVCFV